MAELNFEDLTGSIQFITDEDGLHVQIDNGDFYIFCYQLNQGQSAQLLDMLNKDGYHG